MPFSSDAHQLEKGKRCLYIFLFIILSFSRKANAQFDGETPLQEEVSLTCTFGENINEKRQQFRILDDQSENALKCIWGKGKFFCTVGEGYSFDWRISDKVTVGKSQGPKPSICFCFLVDPDNAMYERPCTVEGPVKPPESEKIETKNPWLDEDFFPRKSLFEEFSQTDSHSRSEDVFVITGVVLTVVSLGLFTAVIFIFIKWRHSQEKDSNSNERLIKTPSEDSDSPMHSV